MTAIGPGDWVECVNNYECEFVRIGGVYFVESCEVHRSGIPCLTLKGIAHPAGYRLVRADGFRPIYRPKADLIEGLLKPVLEAA